MPPTSPLIDAAGSARRLRVAVIGSGIAALSCAWLLKSRHEVVVYERADRLGGHSNTVTARTATGDVAVDTGFIVFNDATYPNLIALFQHLGVATRATDMSFAVSLERGDLEYAAPALFAQPRNLVRPRFWSMLRETLRFYREASADVARLDPTLTLGAYLQLRGFNDAFRDDHLLPMAAAIWSSPVHTLLEYPAQAFIRFCANHGLLNLVGRPTWRTVQGGSRSYVEKLALELGASVRLSREVACVRRAPQGVFVQDAQGRMECFDHVVIGAHADQALAMVAEPTAQEQAVLGAFGYSRNVAVLHTDAGLMPRRRAAWSSWNYMGTEEGLCVTYWMNRLQGLPGQDLFVTLNPPRAPAAGTLLRTERYDHPVFDPQAMAAQTRLWSLQGEGGVWYCGAHFGAGFHEDGLQSGLAVAEQLGGVRRPWSVPNESGRIHIAPVAADRLERVA